MYFGEGDENRFEPIKLTEEDDTLVSYASHLTQDESSCGGGIGYHDYCHGTLILFRTSKKNKTLVCDRCNLRISVPLKVNTYGKLREFFAKKLAEKTKNPS